MKETYKIYLGRAADLIRKIAGSPVLAITILLSVKILFQILIISSGYKWLSSDDYCRTVKAYEWLEKPIIYSGVWLTPHFWLNGAAMYFIKDIFAAATFTNIIFSAFTLIYFFKISDIVFDRKTAIISSLIFCFFPFQVWLSISGLPESVFFFFIIAGLYYFIQWKRHNHNNVYILLAAISLALGNVLRYEGWLFSITLILLTAFELFKDRKFDRAKLISLSFSCISLLTVIWWLMQNLKDHSDMLYFARETEKIYGEFGAVKMFQRVVQYPIFIFYIAPITSFFSLKVVFDAYRKMFGRNNGKDYLLTYFVLYNAVELLLLMMQGVLGTGGTNMVSRYIVVNALLFVPPAVKQIFEFRKYVAVILFSVIITGNIIWSFYYPNPFREDTYETGRLLRGRVEKNFMRPDEKIYFEEVEGYYDVFAVQTVSNYPLRFILGNFPIAKIEEKKKRKKRNELSAEELNILDIKGYLEDNKIALAVVKSDSYAEKLRKMNFKNEEIGDYKIFYIRDIESNLNDSNVTIFSKNVISLKDNSDIINFNKTIAVRDIRIDNTNFGFNPQTITIDWASVNKGIIDSLSYNEFDFDRYKSVVEIRTEESDSLVYSETRKIFSDRNIEDLIEKNQVRNIIVLKPFAMIYYSKKFTSSPFESGVYNLSLKVIDTKSGRELPVFKGDSLIKKEDIKADSLTTKLQDSLKTKPKDYHISKDSIYYSYSLGTVIAFFPNTDINNIVTKGGTSFYRVITRNGLQVFFSQRYQADHFLNYVFNYF